MLNKYVDISLLGLKGEEERIDRRLQYWLRAKACMPQKDGCIGDTRVVKKMVCMVVTNLIFFSLP